MTDTQTKTKSGKTASERDAVWSPERPSRETARPRLRIGADAGQIYLRSWISHLFGENGQFCSDAPRDLSNLRNLRTSSMSPHLPTFSPEPTIVREGKAMIPSSRRDRRAKAFAEVLAMIANAHSPPAPNRTLLEADEWLFETATEFCAALEKYVERATRIK
jgi:hypothetical protein